MIASTAFAQTVAAPTIAPVPTAGDVPSAPKESPECSCVKIARSLGANIPLGTDASDLTPNTTPHVGVLVLLRYGEKYHVAVLEGIDGGFQVAEGHFVKGPCVPTRRTIDFNDPHIRGFWENKGA